jgi:O-antigen ligase
MESAMTGTVTRADIPGAVAFPQWVSKAVVGSFLMASFTATWGGIHFGGLQMVDIFLLPAFVFTAAMVVFGNLRFPIPGWLWVPPVALLACFNALILSPIPAASFAVRYEHAIRTADGGAKSVFWIVALLVVPIAAIACAALDSRAPKWIMAWFLAGAAVSSLIALTDLTKLTHVSRTLGFRFTDAESNGTASFLRQPGLSSHPNAAGLACAIAAPFAVHFISESRRRWLPCIALVLLCGGVVASGSRGAQVVLPAAVLIAIFVSPHKKKLVGWLAATLAAAILGGLTVLMQLAPGILGKLFRFDGMGSTKTSNLDRVRLWTQAWSDFKDHPIFGIGIKYITESHCIYLQIMAAGGIVLVAGMLIYWFGTLRSCWLATRTGEALGRYLMTSVIAWLVIGFMENQLTDRYLYYTVGCAAALAATYRVGTPAGRLPGRETRQAA